MSSFYYGRLTRQREATPSRATWESTLISHDVDVEDAPPTAPTLSTFVDSILVLVPAEMLAGHALLMQVATETQGEGDAAQVVLKSQDTLKWMFWFFVFGAMVLFALGKGKSNWTPLDGVRMLLPGLAFVAWTISFRPTVFDAVFDVSDEVTRVALVIVLVIPILALGIKLGSIAQDD